jgi:acetyltransferase-like isoleucine patch superfamily enzyme
MSAKLEVMPGAKLSIGKGVRVMAGSHVSIQENAHLTLGDYSWVGPYNIIYCAEQINIGTGTRVSHFCSIIDHDYRFRSQGNFFDLPKTTMPIRIGDFSWLGAGSILLKGVRLGNRCVVGANTLLRAGEVPAGGVIARPADNASQFDQPSAGASSADEGQG